MEMYSDSSSYTRYFRVVSCDVTVTMATGRMRLLNTDCLLDWPVCPQLQCTGPGRLSCYIWYSGEGLGVPNVTVICYTNGILHAVNFLLYFFYGTRYVRP